MLTLYGDELPSGVVSKRKAHESGCTVTTFSSQGGVAASGGGDGYVKVWDIARGSDVKQIKIPASKSISGVGFNNTCSLLVAAGTDLSINLIKNGSGLTFGSKEF